MATTLQTLDRGLRALEVVAEHAEGISVAELAERLDVHRAIAYRIVTTLEQHGLVARTSEGALRLGAGISLLASRFEPQLRAVAQPLLQALAKATRATAFVSVAQGEECVVLLVAEPEEGLLRVGYRVGSRHPLTLGAAGIAILAGRPPRADDSEAVRQARADGYSLTRGQLQRGAVGVASSVATPQLRPGLEACVGVVAMDDLDTGRAIREVKAYAQELAEQLGR
ncbi:helix-turn-helix domain-containing protein [Halomonas sp. MCCC 1A17488]|uniref:HTH-type transcriptional repressor AllR n=1 Tax=Billgrantia sulfidoxydans TaxID=2733484 RepID=A0ABX7VXQ0_9GAMM|nr:MULTISPECIES: helix-turn-helix domain-containing protein [Halomonas]MCE8017208.1 helix-turn-helix domain-containing protein [Halomonas sp. MCCC 1A17488]MCG3240541.1 helix-turn-helix domain-containing protein [Halomonas sp. MCCC 1A17488]QPP49603.1 helix-turn-helix domain-containing protein [Halomonas sp. SS10-MC5]QTP53239.1 helix-turn-helix domain-containing protein [Halomonas sulfidoxydans]